MKPHVKVKVQFGKAVRPSPAPEPGRVPRIARLLALAHYIDEQIHAGEIADLADAARQGGLTRARVTQVMNLMLLAPKIQERILARPGAVSGRDMITERLLRQIVREPLWQKQLAAISCGGRA